MTDSQNAPGASAKNRAGGELDDRNDDEPDKTVKTTVENMKDGTGLDVSTVDNVMEKSSMILTNA